MKPLRAAVVGVGYLGRFHAQKYAALPGVVLTAVVDINPARAAEVARETGARPCTDVRDILGQVDVASVVVPSSLHYAVGRILLEAGVHVLMEKPITEDVAQARALIELSHAHGCVLQVGHLERFRPVVRDLMKHARTPMFIEAHRLAPFKHRGTDVNVVLDLMIHDIDLALTLVNAPIEQINASGVPVLSDQIDIANARIQFSNGCVANLTASRVSLKSERRLRLFQADAYLAADMSGHTLDWYRKAPGQAVQGLEGIAGERLHFPAGDPLLEEIRAFLDCVRSGTPPPVSGEDGLRALETALEVVRQLQARPLPGMSAQTKTTPRNVPP